MDGEGNRKMVIYQSNAIKRLLTLCAVLSAAVVLNAQEFPFLWQQVEYVLGGGSSHYMFLVLASMDLLK